MDILLETEFGKLKLQKGLSGAESESYDLACLT